MATSEEPSGWKAETESPVSAISRKSIAFVVRKPIVQMQMAPNGMTGMSSQLMRWRSMRKPNTGCIMLLAMLMTMTSRPESVSDRSSRGMMMGSSTGRKLQ